MNDPTQPPLPPELRLLDEYFDGTLSQERAAQLRDFINADPKNAEQVILAAFLHRNLRDAIAGHRTLRLDYLPHSTLNDAQILPALREESDFPDVPIAPDPFIFNAPPPVGSPRKRRFPWPALAVAASVLLIAAIALVFFRTTPPATLTALVDARLPVPFAMGQSLSDGPFTLTSGLAQITFTNGASIILEGPASIAIDSPSSVHLLSGKLTTWVPHDAAGFTVHGPDASVIDLGTEVGINVQPQDQMHVEIFTGRAQVQLADGTGSRILTASMAVNIPAAAPAIAEAAPQPLTFVRPAQLQVRSENADTPYARWQAFSAQLARDPHLIAYYTFDSTPDAGQLVNHALAAAGTNNGIIENAAPTTGRFPEKSALLFNGSTSRVKLNIPGSFPELTLAAWVNMREYKNPRSALMLCDGVTNRSIFHWEFNRTSSVPPYIEFGVHQSGWAHYPFPLDVPPVGRWHLVVVTYDMTANTIRCSFDGHSLGDHPLVAPKPLVIGSAQIGNWNLEQGGSRAMNGRFDELAIWNRPLSDQEIQVMYAAGAPINSAP